MEIRPIRTENDYEHALSEIARLFNAKEGTEDFDRLDLLTTLVEVYETKHHPILPPDPVAAIEYEAEKRGLSRRDLERYIGPSGRVSEVMNGSRPLSMTMVRKLRSGLGISADVLVSDAPPKRRRKAAI
ncbi:MAG TPA: helix-turn-helix domain-containing protein [Capsulimonadaceae bacterium]|jgi:HTH-type transcriptional regulator/antitoxin HigA